MRLETWGRQSKGEDRCLIGTTEEGVECVKRDVTVAIFQIQYDCDYFIIKMHYSSCFLNLLGGTIEIVSTIICVKIRQKQQKDVLQNNTENAASFLLLRGHSERNQQSASNHLTEQKYAITSVYYIFSIQVYITFLSIQVHILLMSYCVFVFTLTLRCWLILGHNFLNHL